MLIWDLLNRSNREERINWKERKAKTEILTNHRLEITRWKNNYELYNKLLYM